MYPGLPYERARRQKKRRREAKRCVCHSSVQTSKENGRMLAFSSAAVNGIIVDGFAREPDSHGLTIKLASAYSVDRSGYETAARRFAQAPATPLVLLAKYRDPCRFGRNFFRHFHSRNLPGRQGTSSKHRGRHRKTEGWQSS